jgi:arylsulfatase A-like enzyme
MKKMSTRRKFLQYLGYSSASLLFPKCKKTSKSAAIQSEKGKTNIILIMADDIGYECFGSYGSRVYKTPELDRLAADGVRFDHCYSQPLCTPSRVKIMTGKYNLHNYTDFGILRRGEKTFGHILHEAGYKTCVAGKWQLFGSISQKELKGTGTFPLDAGFDEYCLWQIDDIGSRYKDPLIHTNDPQPEKLEGKYGPDVFCDYIVDFINRNKNKSFFIYYPMALVHSPFVPTPDSRDWKKVEIKSNVKYFPDMVAYMDKLIGRIVEETKKLGLREKTLIMFTSDNGTHRQIKSEYKDEVISGGKGYPTDAGTRVPFIASMPGTIPRGMVCDDLIDFSDFLPTIADVGQYKISEQMQIDGRSFRPQLQGKPGSPREWIFCDYNPKWGKHVPSRFVRNKRWKLYQNGEFYDLSRDVLEENPLSPDQMDEETRKIRKKLQDVLDSLK